MANKQLCDPFRGGVCRQATGFVRPGSVVEKGDMVMRDPNNPQWIISVADCATVAAAHTGFLGVASNAKEADQVDRRLVFNYTGNYMYPLSTASEANIGDSLILVLDGTSSYVEPQKWVISSTTTYEVAKVVRAAPDWDYMYDTHLSTTFTVDTDTDTEDLTLGSNIFAVGDSVRLFSSAGDLPAGLTAGTRYFVKTNVSGAITLSLTSGGDEVSMSDDGSGTLTIEAYVGRGTATEVEGALVSTLL